MKKFAFAIFLFSAQSFAIPHGMCRLGFYGDSEGRGIEEGVTGQSSKPIKIDQTCYDQGVEIGQQAKRGDSDCLSEFNAGKSQGLRASNNAAGDGCYPFGYSAGFALLEVSARQGDLSVVGADCVNQYQSGLADGTANPDDSSNAPNDSKAHACYLTGFNDSDQVAAAAQAQEVATRSANPSDPIDNEDPHKTDRSSGDSEDPHQTDY